jgi:hypothetical protein
MPWRPRRCAATLGVRRAVRRLQRAEPSLLNRPKSWLNRLRRLAAVGHWGALRVRPSGGPQTHSKSREPRATAAPGRSPGGVREESGRSPGGGVRDTRPEPRATAAPGRVREESGRIREESGRVREEGPGPQLRPGVGPS